MGELVSFAPDGAIGTITLHSPPANPLGAPLLNELHGLLDEVEASGVKAVVVRSGLERFFAAGADIKLMSTLDREGFADYMATIRRPFERLAAMACMSVAAIEGVTLGGGLELACACTLRVAGRDAKLGVPETKLGLLPGAGGTQRLPRMIGRGRALDLLLTGRSVGAEEALAIGLVDRLVDAGQAEAAAYELVGELASYSTPALAALVRCADASLNGEFAAGMEVEREELLGVVTDGEAHEGLAAFLEKRTPKFA